MSFGPSSSLYPAMPEIAQAYENDPKTKIAAALVKAGMNTAPAAAGKYGFGDGIGRMMQAIAGAMMQKSALSKYQDQDKLAAAQMGAVMSGGEVPQGIDKAGLISPQNLYDPLASVGDGPGGAGGAAAPGVGGMGAAAGGTGVSGGALPAPGNNVGTTPQVPAAPQNMSPPAPPVPNQATGGPAAIAAALGAPPPSAPQQTAPAAPGADPHAFFKNFVSPSEGSKAVIDTNGALVKYGINAKANPGVDVKNLTEDGAGKIFEDKYWKGSGADKIANPGLAYMHADTYYLNPKQSQQILAASGGDPEKYMSLRRDFLNGLVTAHPEKYGEVAHGWENRNARLEKYAQTYGGGAPASQVQTATGAQLSLPEMPGMPAQPDAPHATARAQSGSLSMARALMATRNPFLMQTAQRMMEKGLDEDFKSQSDYAGRADEINKDVYDKGADRYNNADQIDRQYAANSRLQANNQISQSADTKYTQGQENARTAQQIEAQKQIAAGNNATSVQVANISAGSKSDQALDRQSRWLQTPQGNRAATDMKTAVEKNNGKIALLQQFKQLSQKVRTGGLAGTSIGNGLRQMIGSPDFQRLRQITDQLTPLMRVKGDIMSDKDAERYARSVPNPGNLNEANDASADFMIRATERENDYQQASLEAQSKNDFVNFNKEWAAFKNRVPLESGMTFDQWKESLPKVDASGKVVR